MVKNKNEKNRIPKFPSPGILAPGGPVPTDSDRGVLVRPVPKGSGGNLDGLCASHPQGVPPEPSVFSAGQSHCRCLRAAWEQFPCRQQKHWNKPSKATDDIGQYLGLAGLLVVLGGCHKEDKDGWNAGSCVKGWGAREGSRGWTSGEISGLSINAYVGNLEKWYR